MEKPSGLTRCRRAPVLAASRITLPAFGGISGCTRTISSIGREGSRNDPVDHAHRAGALEGCRKLIERRAGGHDIIDHRDRRAVERALAAERAAHVARPVRPRQIGLGSRISFSRDRKSTRLNSSHGYISYAVFCLKKK